MLVDIIDAPEAAKVSVGRLTVKLKESQKQILLYSNTRFLYKLPTPQIKLTRNKAQVTIVTYR